MSLDVSKLSVSYGTTLVLREASFSLPGRSVTALIGPNGTGKSTLLKSIAGLIAAGGTVALNGRQLEPDQRGRSIAYMPQDIGPSSSLTILEVVLLGRLRSLGLHVPRELRRLAETTLAQFGLETFQTRTLDAVSGGQRQLVYLAQALFRQPDMLLLDEPTASLDLKHQLIVLEAVRKHCSQNGVTAIMAMHDLTLAARFADRIICLHDGRIAAHGTPTEVLTEERIRIVYGVEADITVDANGFPHVTPIRAAEAELRF